MISTYHDVQSLGVEKLRQIYQAAQLTLRPASSMNKEEVVRQMISALGEDPDKWLRERAKTEPHRVVIGPEEREAALTQIFREVVRRVVLDGKFESSARNP